MDNNQTRDVRRAHTYNDIVDLVSDRGAATTGVRVTVKAVTSETITVVVKRGTHASEYQAERTLASADVRVGDTGTLISRWRPRAGATWAPHNRGVPLMSAAIRGVTYPQLIVYQFLPRAAMDAICEDAGRRNARRAAAAFTERCPRGIRVVVQDAGGPLAGVVDGIATVATVRPRRVEVAVRTVRPPYQRTCGIHSVTPCPRLSGENLGRIVEGSCP